MAEDNGVYAISYHGEIVNDGAEGYGTMKFSNGVEFTGMFHDDSPSGPGVLQLPDGSMFVGTVNGLAPSGHGVVFHPKTPIGHQPFAVGYWVDGYAEGLQITLSDIHRQARKEFSIISDGEVSGKGMIATLGPGSPNPIVPKIFEIIDGERKFSEEQLFQFQRDSEKQSSD
jgi:hypothetical protein